MIMGFGVILRLKTNVPVRNMNVFPEVQYSTTRLCVPEFYRVIIYESASRVSYCA